MLSTERVHSLLSADAACAKLLLSYKKTHPNPLMVNSEDIYHTFLSAALQLSADLDCMVLSIYSYSISSYYIPTIIILQQYYLPSGNYQSLSK